MKTKVRKPIISKYFKQQMKEVTLNVLERVVLIGIFNNKEAKTDIETLRAVLDDVKEVGLSDEEKKEINIRDVFGEDGKTVVSVEWDKPIDKVINLNSKTVEFILNFIKVKSEAKELGVGDAPLLKIQDKLK